MKIIVGLIIGAFVVLGCSDDRDKSANQNKTTSPSDPVDALPKRLADGQNTDAISDLEREIAAIVDANPVSTTEFVLSDRGEISATISLPEGAKIVSGYHGVGINLGRGGGVLGEGVTADIGLSDVEFAETTATMRKASSQILVDTDDLFFAMVGVEVWVFATRVPFGSGDCLATLWFGHSASLKDALLLLYCVRTLAPKESMPEDPIAQLAALGWHIERRDEHVWLSRRGGIVSDPLIQLVAGIPSVSRLEVDGISDLGVAHLSKAIQLQRLEIDMSNCSEQSFSHLAGLKSLQYLKITGARCSDESMAFLREMNELRSLEIRQHLHDDSHQISGAGLRYLEGKEHLAMLNLGGYPITDDGLAALPPLRSLTELVLPSSKITGKTLSQLNLPSLRTLHLEGSPVNDVRGLTSFRQLTELALSNTKLTDNDLSALVDLPNLYSLYLHAIPFTNDAVPYFRKMSGLRGLVLSETQIDDDGFRGLCQLANLEHLTVNHTALTDSIFATLKSAKQIKSVELHGTKVTNELVKRLKVVRPDLEVRTD